MYEKKWSEWNSIGFIPGPHEDEISFKNRVDYCLSLKRHLSNFDGIPENLSNLTSDQFYFKEVIPQTKNLYGIDPSWVLLFIDNSELKPWQGGSTWIFQLELNSPTAGFIQIRKHFLRHRTYLKIYHRNELISHECAHIGRMMYEEPKFEEFFAYQSSPSKWRQWMGPLIQSSKESLFFILSIALIIFADIAYLMNGMEIKGIFWIKLFPVLLILGGVIRLLTRHYTLYQCRLHLERLLPSTQARHLMYRLKDDEIESFASFSRQEILNFADKEKESSFRWKFLYAIYFGDSFGES